MSLSAKEKYDLSWGQPSDNGRAKRMVWGGVGGTTTGGKVGCQNRPIILSYGAHAAVKRVLLTKGKLSLDFFNIMCKPVCQQSLGCPPCGLS